MWGLGEHRRPEFPGGRIVAHDRFHVLGDAALCIGFDIKTHPDLCAWNERAAIDEVRLPGKVSKF